MRRVKYFALFGLILSLGIASNVVNASAVITTSSSYAIADTYVDKSQSSNNYGGQDDIRAGMANGWVGYYRAYIAFDLSNKPSNFVKAEISLEFHHVPTTLYYNVNRVDGSWNEFTLSGDDCSDEFTAAIDGPLITYLTVPSNGQYKIDVTNYVQGNINFSINIESQTNNSDNYADIYSRDQDIGNRKPKITWTYENYAIDPTIYAIIVGVIVLGVLGVSGAVFYIYKKKGSPSLRSASYQEELPAFQQAIPERRAKKSDRICWYCEKAIPKNFNVCPSCGAKLE